MDAENVLKNLSKSSGDQRQVPDSHIITRMKDMWDTPIDWNNVAPTRKTNLMDIIYQRLCGYMNPDIFVKIDRHIFCCHLLVLQSYTTFFCNYGFGEVVELPQNKVPPAIFHTMYDWMLSNDEQMKNVITRRNLLDLLVASQYLGTNELELQCWDFIESRAVFNEETALLLLVRAREIGNLRIINMMLPRIKHSFLHLVSSLEYNHLPVDVVCMLLSSNFISVHSEIQVFMAAVKWLMYDWENRINYSVKVLSCIRFGLMTASEIVYILRGGEFDEVTRIPQVHAMLEKGRAHIAIRHLYGHDENELQLRLGLLEITSSEPRMWTGEKRKYKSYDDFIADLQSCLKSESTCSTLSLPADFENFCSRVEVENHPLPYTVQCAPPSQCSVVFQNYEQPEGKFESTIEEIVSDREHNYSRLQDTGEETCSECRKRELQYVPLDGKENPKYYQHQDEPDIEFLMQGLQMDFNGTGIGQCENNEQDKNEAEEELNRMLKELPQLRQEIRLQQQEIRLKSREIQLLVKQQFNIRDAETLSKHNRLHKDTKEYYKEHETNSNTQANNNDIGEEQKDERSEEHECCNGKSIPFQDRHEVGPKNEDESQIKENIQQSKDGLESLQDKFEDAIACHPIAEQCEMCKDNVQHNISDNREKCTEVPTKQVKDIKNIKFQTDASREKEEKEMKILNSTQSRTSDSEFNADASCPELYFTSHEQSLAQITQFMSALEHDLAVIDNEFPEQQQEYPALKQLLALFQRELPLLREKCKIVDRLFMDLREKCSLILKEIPVLKQGLQVLQNGFCLLDEENKILTHDLKLLGQRIRIIQKKRRREGSEEPKFLLQHVALPQIYVEEIQKGELPVSYEENQKYNICNKRMCELSYQLVKPDATLKSKFSSTIKSRPPWGRMVISPGVINK